MQVSCHCAIYMLSIILLKKTLYTPWYCLLGVVKQWSCRHCDSRGHKHDKRSPSAPVMAYLFSLTQASKTPGNCLSWRKDGNEGKMDINSFSRFHYSALPRPCGSNCEAIIITIIIIIETIVSCWSHRYLRYHIKMPIMSSTHHSLCLSFLRFSLNIYAPLSFLFISLRALSTLTGISVQS